MRLLVIDDDPDVWAVVEAASNAHPDVELIATAATPEEGLAISRRAEPDAILLDHVFHPARDAVAIPGHPSPRGVHGLSGLEAVEYLRAAAPDAVIALYTGVSGLRKSAEHAGADLYVVKGPNLREVLDDLADRTTERGRP